MAMFDRAMKMFSPFAFTGAVPGAAEKADEPEPRAEEPAAAQSLAELKRQMESMRAQLDKLSSNPDLGR
jgi:polyhydroxyalkanoate synthesis regulator protein